MNPDEPQDPQEENMSFAELLDAYDEGRTEDLRIGDKVTVKIIALGKDVAYVDTGTKIDGAVDRAELLDAEGQLAYAVGDTLDLYVVEQNESEIRLSRALDGVGGLDLLQEAMDGQVPVEGKVEAVRKGGFEVRLMQQRAFCPVSQMDVRYVERQEDYVGQTLAFLITRIEARGCNIVVSRRQLLEREQAAAREAFLADLAPGAIREGRVRRLTPFGVFVELVPGLDGLVHISEISWRRVADPQEVVREGDVVTVKVLSIQDAERSGEKKLALSMKQAENDPWETQIERFNDGDAVPALITRCAPFGAFAELTPGIEGLIHISELSFTRRVQRPEEVVTVGETVTVMIKSIDRTSRRIALSLKDAGGDPWQGASDQLRLGQVQEGVVVKRAPFGLLIEIAPGIVGLYPKARFSQTPEASRLEKLKPGERVTVTIEKVDTANRRLTLGPEDAQEQVDWQALSDASASPSLGGLAEKLKAALDAKQKK